MEASLLDRMRGGLVETRQNLLGWLQVTPPRKKQIRFGPADEQAVRDHLTVLDDALEKAGDETLGVCRVCHEYVDSKLLLTDYTASVCLDHLSEEEARRLESELELSTVVQRALLPQQAPDIPGLDIAAFSRPAQIVGGDYFDFFRYRDGAHGLAVADVSGHGVSASLLMASMQTALRTLIPESDSPSDVLRRVNRFFIHNVNFTTFVTLFLARFNPATRTLRYANAGHNPPLVFRNGGMRERAWLEPTGAAIGLIEDFAIAEQTLTLKPEAVLLLYTDGVTEAVNPEREEFGRKRLAQVVQRQSGSSAVELVGAIRQALSEFAAGQPLDDDTTIVACKVVQ